jgi:alpha-glucoside transport system permease protein
MSSDTLLNETPSTRQSKAQSFDLRRFLGWFGLRATLIIICVIWTVPTIGLLVTSFREPSAIRTTGWWTALTPSTTQASVRTGTEVQEIDGRWVIKGELGDAMGGGSISRFGLTQREPTAFDAGEAGETNDGFTVVMNSDGTYELSSNEAFTLDRGRNIYYEITRPPRFTLDNYKTVLEANGIGKAFNNTLAVTIPATIIPIAIAAFAAYAFSWMEFPGRKLMFIVVVGLMVVPLQMALIPMLRIYSSLGIRGTMPGMWLAHSAFGLPLAVFLLRNYIGSLPREIIESAQIDGATHFQIFIRLVLPLSVPALAAFGIFQFLWVWNDLLVARVFLGSGADNQVLTGRIQSMTGTYGNDWHIMTSAAFVSIIVPLIVFFSLQRYFVRGLMAGSVKGG